MSYVVLARKWRPTRFEDLVGQEHVARTLANAIASGRIAHAFLFTGVRGVGKTTSARLLARSLNCLGPARPEGTPDPGPTSTPCLECAACREITAGSDVDVREIDGASYNGVDEVRKLQDSLPYRPTRDRYKIFIIDEVHMLSQSAWNAFLKTLEEPPPHVKFIFATTEVHKVPITILSRVQRFDFKMIPARLIADRLRHVLGAEGIATDEAALSIIAREAAGSMRDAMSLLDQVIAWNDRGLDGESVALVLGVASRKVLHDLAASLVEGDAAKSLQVIEQISQQGFDLAHVTKNFLELLRDLVVAKVCTNTSELIDLPDEERRDVSTLSSRTSADDLMRLYQGFSAGYDDVLRGGHPRSALEMLLVRLCRRPPLIPLDDLVMRLSGLEKRLGTAASAAPAMRRPAPVAPAQAPYAPQTVDVAPPQSMARPRESQSSSPRREPPPGDNSDEPAPGTAGASVSSSFAENAPPTSGGQTPTSAGSQARAAEPAPSPSLPSPNVSNGPPPPRPVEPRSAAASSPTSAASSTAPASQSHAPGRGASQPNASQGRSVSQPPSAATSDASSRAKSQGPARSSYPPPSDPARARPSGSATHQPTSASMAPNSDFAPEPPNPDDLMAKWQETVERIQAVRPEVSAVLEHAVLIEQTKERMTVGWPPDSVFAAQYDEQLLIELIRTALTEQKLSIRDVIIAKNDPRVLGLSTLASRETAERTRKYREDQARVRNHPKVKDTIEVLGARIVSVRLNEQRSGD